MVPVRARSWAHSYHHAIAASASAWRCLSVHPPRRLPAVSTGEALGYTPCILLPRHLPSPFQAHSLDNANPTTHNDTDSAVCTGELQHPRQARVTSMSALLCSSDALDAATPTQIVLPECPMEMESTHELLTSYTVTVNPPCSPLPESSVLAAGPSSSLGSRLGVGGPDDSTSVLRNRGSIGCLNSAVFPMWAGAVTVTKHLTMHHNTIMITHQYDTWRRVVSTIPTSKHYCSAL
ncbi:hypothetical protein B0H10DRAFT_1950010 [Mycena sp. CBHHK59/15]|nr:hypothetical protein B0H10DRAFT_1950010 [Mycena sp. CBHHK59/15]